MTTSAPPLPPCVRCRSPLERGDLLCAVCGAPAPAAPAREVDRATALVLRCRSCSAAVGYDAAVQAPRCAFCGEVMEREEIADPLEQAGAFLPFGVGREEARAALARWLAGLGFFRPSDLRSSARVESLTPLWWVGWAFDAEADVTWAADSDAGSRRSSWAPHAGRATLTFDDIVVSASRGLSDAETSALARSYDLATARAAPEGVEGDATVEEFDLQRSAARARVMAAVEAQSAARIEAEHVPGRRARNVRTAALVRRLETRRLAFPAWVMAWRYKGELYRLVVSGQDARCLVGRAPWSLVKITLAVLAGLALVALVVALVAAA